MKNLLVALAIAAGLLVSGSKVQAAPKPAAKASTAFDVCWSHYTGWEPWAYADEKGILKKWADKYGIKIKLTLVNDYVESINLYTAGKFQGCVMTNMDALTIPAVGGVDSSAIIVGDYSNGNDGIVAKNLKTVKDLKGKKIKLVQLSVSHYLLSRALEKNGMSEKDVTVVNTSDADIGQIFTSEKDGIAVTWNPTLMKIRALKGANMVFDSSQIPGEILDLMVVRTDAPEALKKALTGAWFETLKVMSASDKTGKEAIAFMAEKAGGTVPEFEAQLKTTALYATPAKALEFMSSAKPKENMEFVRTFSFDKGLFGEGAKDKNFVGIEFGDKSVLGDAKKVKLRFDPTYTKMAADGKL